MAITEIPQSPQQKQYAIAEQTTWGTAVLDNAAMEQLHCEHFEIDRDIKTFEVPQALGTRNARDSSIITHTNGAMPKATITAVATHDLIDYFLYGMIQNVTEGETTPFSKTFTFSSTQPDFDSSAGEFFTIVERDPASSKSTKMVDAIVQSLTLSLAEGEPLKMAAECVGRGLASVTADPSGTWTVYPVTDAWWFNALDRATIDFGSGDVNFHLKACEFTLAQTVVPVGQDGSGSFNTYALTERALSAKITVIKDADFHTALSNYAAGTAITGNIGWGNATPGTDDGDFDIVYRGMLNGVTKTHDDPMAAELSVTLLEDNTGATDPITIVMANANDRTW